MAMQLLFEKLVMQGMPDTIAQMTAFTIVCDAMVETERIRLEQQENQRWFEIVSAIHYN